jgi:hypothetical protein
MWHSTRHVTLRRTRKRLSTHWTAFAWHDAPPPVSQVSELLRGVQPPGGVWEAWGPWRPHLGVLQQPHRRRLHERLRLLQLLCALPHHLKLPAQRGHLRTRGRSLSAHGEREHARSAGAWRGLDAPPSLEPCYARGSGRRLRGSVGGGGCPPHRPHPACAWPPCCPLGQAARSHTLVISSTVEGDGLSACGVPGRVWARALRESLVTGGLRGTSFSFTCSSPSWS